MARTHERGQSGRRSLTPDQARSAAITLYRRDDVAGARQLADRILEAVPKEATTLHLRGVIAHREGEPRAAVRWMRRAVRAGRRELAFDLANALRDCGRTGPAIRAYRAALARDPNDAHGHANLGRLLWRRGDAEGAREALDAAIGADPEHLDARRWRAELNLAEARPADAIRDYEAAVACAPSRADLAYNLANTLAGEGRFAEAEGWYRRALDLAPAFPDAHNNRAIVLSYLGALTDALAAAEHAVALAPGRAALHDNLANIRAKAGDLDGAIASRRAGLARDPDDARIHAHLLFDLHHHPAMTAQGLVDAQTVWARQVCPAPPAPLPVRAPRGDRPLTVGLMSPKFRRHPTLMLTLPALEALDPARVRLAVYADGIVGGADDVTERLSNRASLWRRVDGLDDAAATATIRGDGVDVLIEMAGLLDGRTGVIARRAAPVQVKWGGGQINTTGLPAMDVFLGDAVANPPADDARYVETIHRMPGGYVAYRPPDDAPAPGPLPARATGHATFGCFNKAAKLNDPILGAWARILRQRPDARLRLVGQGYDVPGTRDRIRAAFDGAGVDPDRIAFTGMLPHGELLRAYRHVDVALDPWPYSGGVTTLEALWMGVPVVTLPGPSFAGRHAATHLTHAGLGAWVADSVDDYVAKAVRAAGDGESLEALRAGLRARLARSPLCDGPRFARNLETALAAMVDRAR